MKRGDYYTHSIINHCSRRLIMDLGLIIDYGGRNDRLITPCQLFVSFFPPPSTLTLNLDLSFSVTFHTEVLSHRSLRKYETLVPIKGFQRDTARCGCSEESSWLVKEFHRPEYELLKQPGRVRQF